jgi:amidohydrolase
MTDLYQDALELEEYTRFLRRDFHRHPELGFKEVRTAGVVSRELSQLGLEVTSGVAQTGVVAMIEGAQPGPVALLRFDMDALPILEETGAEYASQIPGVMHACGHDGHVAIGLTVARILQERRGQIHGAVKLVFQPAEEGAGGAEQMVAAGVMDDPKVDYTLSMHVWNEMPVGCIGISSGPLMAGADLFSVTVEGKGGHGALPHSTIDPVVVCAQMILALQTIVSRNLSPLESAVLSVGRVRAGDAFNVIPQTAEFGGTFRTFEPEVRAKLLARFEEIIQSTAAAMQCKATTQVKVMTPSVINDPGVAAMVREAAMETIPDLQLIDSLRTMVSEDMAYMMQKAPGCYVLVGSANADKGLNYGHHHPRFDIDEAVLPKAAAVMAAAALRILR